MIAEPQPDEGSVPEPTLEIERPVMMIDIACAGFGYGRISDHSDPCLE